MICPRCGTVAAGQSATCTRCGGKLGRGDSAAARAEPPVPRAPTHRGEAAQRAAGIVPQVLARPKAPSPAPAPAPVPLVAPPDQVPDATAPEGQVWPPPPAVWEPGPGAAARPAEPPATTAFAGSEQSPPAPGPSPGAAPAPRWAAPGSGHSRNPSRLAAAWSRATAGATRDAAPPTTTGAGTPSNYLWQSLACLFLFLPSALIAILYSTQVNRRVQIGDMTGAIRASRMARTWCLVTVGVFALLVLWLMAGGSAP